MKQRKPYVTQLISLLDKPALLGWANRIGLEGVSIDAFRAKALDKGKTFHEQIHRRLTDGTPFPELDDNVNFDLFMAGKRVLSVEKVIETEWFLGRLDLAVEVEGSSVICDFKPGSKIYFEQVLQLVAYRMAEGGAIAIVETPTFKMKRVSIPDFEPFEKLLKALAEIYREKKLCKWSEE